MPKSITLRCIENLRELNFEINLTNFYSSADYDGAMTLCEHPDRSAIPPKYLTVTNVEQLKSLIGRPDNLSKNHVEARTPLLPATPINEPFHPDVCEALNTYLYGDSTSITPGSIP